jgi:hypothetical protein
MFVGEQRRQGNGEEKEHQGKVDKDLMEWQVNVFSFRYSCPLSASTSDDVRKANRAALSIASSLSSSPPHYSVV